MNNGSGRCRLHGGASRRGTEHPNYKDGRYIRRDHNLGSLGAYLEAHMIDPDFLSSREEIALLRLRIDDQLEHLERMRSSHEGMVAWQQAQESLLLLKRSVAHSNPAQLQHGLALLEEAVNSQRAADECWSEIAKLSASVSRFLGREFQLTRISQLSVSNTESHHHTQ